MTITRLQRQQAEDNANETQLRLYAEPESGEQLWAIATKHDLTERLTYFAFSQMVGDVILGFYKIDDIGALISHALPQIQGVQKIGLEADIKMFLYPLTVPTAAGKGLTVNAPRLVSEISEAEHDLASLHSVRTMSNDMASIRPGSDVVYQSSQADILRATTPIVAPPAPDAPRWDTDTK